MTDRIGQHVGNYQLVQLLGQGGQASVYLGKHRYLNSYAALKVLHATIQPGDEYKFITEAQRLVDLQHPNIIRLLDFGIETGTPVLIMDYAPNGSLRQQAPFGTQMPLTTVVEVVPQIAAALQYAHNRHVIHRDIKPENILLDANNHVLLSDFGLSLLTLSSQPLSTQDPVGTPRYMAPEQLRGKPCFASDQYALAVMVYEWLCGKLPFRGTMWEIWQQHLYTDPLPLRAIRPELPLRLEKVVLRALAKKPQDRFVTIQAFALAVAQASQTSTPTEENASQVTAPIQAILSSSPIALSHHVAALSPQVNQIAQIPARAFTLMTTQQTRVSALRSQNRVRMLGRLRRSYHDLVRQSLQGAAWLELGLADKPDAVQNAAHLLLHMPNRAVQHLPPSTSIAQVYEEAEHELLILGEPGAGKSTLLLDLAEHLVVRAEQDHVHPLPVILPLSSWAVKRLPLQDWMAEQLAQIYDVPLKLCIQWEEEEGILPLLDGLDEMDQNARPVCIEAINTYHRDHLTPLVVCSRTTEYEEAAERHRLSLQRAVIVQPLTHEDVDAYLVRSGKPLMALRSALKKNAALLDLATTPLMLNILTITYQDPSVYGLSSSESLLLKQVWDDYVQRMVERKGNCKRYPLSLTLSWLGFLARQMRQHNQTVFYLEHLQPDWLVARQQHTYTWLAILLPAIVIGILINILVHLFFAGNTDLSSLLQYSILGGLLGGLRHRLVSKQEGQKEHGHVWGMRLAISVGIGLIYGLSFGFSLGSHYTLSDWLIGGLSSGIGIGLGSLLLQSLLTIPFHPRTSSRKSTTGLWKRMVRFWFAVQGPRALLVTVVTKLIYWLGFILSIALSYKLNYRMSKVLRYDLFYRLSDGLSYPLISLALGTHMGGVRLTERLRWTWRSLIGGLCNFRHLRLTVSLACSILLFLGSIAVLSHKLVYALSFTLSETLSYTLSYWFLIGLFLGITQERIEDQDRHIVNQGIHRSLRNSVTMGIIGGATIGNIGILMYALDDALSHLLGVAPFVSLSSALSYWLPMWISGGLLIMLVTGGLAVLQHYAIRLLLRRSRTFPMLAPQFLNDATARFLLRRVGGGYSFTHRLLLDHLADTEMTSNAALSPSPLLHPEQ